MPAKNILKYYLKDSTYHIYNRGVEKREIYSTERDYKVFLSYLRIYLLPKVLQGLSLKSFPSRQLKNYSQEIDLLAYCLMPNHFHLLLYQYTDRGIEMFMRALLTKYSMYFNRVNHRVGPLFQGRYKAVRIIGDEQLVYTSKYIHLNPISGSVPEVYPYSSLRNYLLKSNQFWVKPQKVLEAATNLPHYSNYSDYLTSRTDLEVKYYELALS
jgi:putative transposase